MAQSSRPVGNMKIRLHWMALAPLPGQGLVSFGQKKAWQRPTLPPSSGSTIGAAGLNFRVRDGNGWFPCAIVTRQNTHTRERRGDTAAGVNERVRCSGLSPSCPLGLWALGPAPPSESLGLPPFGFAAQTLGTIENMVKPHGKLVLVSSVCCHTYTSSLSTWFSPRYLQWD